MIVVDTSVWIAALRSAVSDTSKALQELIDADEVALAIPVRIELIAGASRKDRVPIRRALSALPVLYPGNETWSMIDEWIEQAAHAGERFGFGDLLIGALAAQHGALVWSLDTDFARMERLRLVARYDL